MWPRVLAPASPKAAASGAPPQPTESITIRSARAIQAIRSWRSGADLGRVLADAVGRPDPRLGRRQRGAVPGVDARERRVGLDDGAEAEQVLEPDRVVDRIARPPPPAAELDDGEAEAAGVDGVDEAVAAGGDVDDLGRAGEMGLEAVEEVRRTAERRDHPGETLGRPARGEGLRHPLRRPPRESAASPPRARSSPPSATVTSQSRLVDDVAAQEARRHRDLEGVARRRRQRLVHVGDERDGPAARRRSPPRRAPRASARASSGVVMKAPRPDLDVEDEGVEAGGELLRQDRGGDEVDRLDRAGHVADRVEPPVGRGDVVGLADDRAADLARRRGARSRGRAGSRSPGCASSLSSVPPVCPRPRPEIIGT